MAALFISVRHDSLLGAGDELALGIAAMLWRRLGSATDELPLASRQWAAAAWSTNFAVGDVATGAAMALRLEKAKAAARGKNRVRTGIPHVSNERSTLACVPLRRDGGSIKYCSFDLACQAMRAPSGTGRSIAVSTTPSSVWNPVSRNSDMNGPTCLGGKLITPTIWRPTSSSAE